MLQREDTSATPRLFAKKTGFKGVKPHANLSFGHYHCSSIFIILTHTHIYIYDHICSLVHRESENRILSNGFPIENMICRRWIFHIDVHLKRKPVWPNGMTPRKIHWKSKGIERPSANGLHGVDIFLKRLEDSYLLSISVYWEDVITFK